MAPCKLSALAHHKFADFPRGIKLLESETQLHRVALSALVDKPLISRCSDIQDCCEDAVVVNAGDDVEKGDILFGDMSFVGTRPEAVKYVERYKPEYNATLLMPAGITSEASIRYKDEDKLLNAADDVDEVYVNEVLPAKMKWNLESIRRFRFLREILTMFRTVLAVMGKEYQ